MPSPKRQRSTPPPAEDLLAVLEQRFLAHPERHADLAWTTVRDRLSAHPGSLTALEHMERTGGEPDVMGRDAATGQILFVDCSPETPAGRLNLCYDREALEARKEHRPAGSAVGTAAEFGIELLTEADYAALQALGEFDLRTSSWLRTPPDIRQRGGALFGDRRYGRVFVYHNGAQSYFSSRGFRGLLRV
jgi:hypothetical protein